MAASSYAHSHHTVSDIATGMLANQAIGGTPRRIVDPNTVDPNLAYLQQKAAAFPIQQLKKEPIVMTNRRIVQVFIVDTYESVPLDKCVIYRGEQKLTDLTDQELFFEIDIKSLLDAHNVERVKLIDKRVKERTEHLEPARIRDLKMTVVTVATF